MKYFRISTIFFLAVAAAFAMSCKKDDGGSSSTKEPLSGTIKYDFPSYVRKEYRFLQLQSGMSAGIVRHQIAGQWKNKNPKRVL